MDSSLADSVTWVEELARHQGLLRMFTWADGAFPGSTIFIGVADGVRWKVVQAERAKQCMNVDDMMTLLPIVQAKMLHRSEPWIVADTHNDETLREHGIFKRNEMRSLGVGSLGLLEGRVAGFVVILGLKPPQGDSDNSTSVPHNTIGALCGWASECIERALQIENTNRALHTVSYALGHDVAAPMRHARRFTQLVVEDEGDTLSETSRDYLGRVERASEKAGVMACQLTDYTRLFQSRKPEVEVIDVEQILTSLKRVNSELRIQIQIEAAARLVYGEESALREIFEELVSNASTFGGDHVRVRVSGQRLPNNDLEFVVEDDGPGVEAVMRERIFHPFVRGSSNRSEHNGIGLARVKRLAERHQGSVIADESQLGGAAFRLVLAGQEPVSE